MTDLWLASHVLLWVAVVAQGVLIFALMRQVGSILLRVGPGTVLDGGVGPRIGDVAPWRPEGLSAHVRNSGPSTLMAFVSSSCGACDDIVPALNGIARSYADSVSVLALGRESPSELEQWKRTRRLKIPAVSAPEAFSEYGIHGTPYVFILDRDGLVAARGGVNHVEHLEALLRRCEGIEAQGEGGVEKEEEETHAV